MRRSHLTIAILTLLSALQSLAAPAELPFERDPKAAFKFNGFVADRIAAGVHHWLLPAPEANPGMLEMFAVRDRQPAPNLVPWAGEFVGKYLISAIQTERLGHPELRPTIARAVEQFIASQADDGYLGPFRKEERLLKHWDLWGHYHCLLALLLWHEQTGDARALACARRAADLACTIYLDGTRRMVDAGSDEMNLSIIHVLGWLHRITKEERYLRLMREIEKDWERGGDFVRAALDGKEFFETPRPRWESLHSLQGLVELYRITGEAKYRTAFEHHWRSIARWDLRNTGGFSSGEQATGNPYSPTPIETCCTIAWMALSTDMLQLTGEPQAADLLELATFNGWAGAQHPSGRWCTYNTPMDGMREASAHTIVFQSRHGTPELNCCSVNGPRGWSMLTDWAVLRSADGLMLNWLAPGHFTAHLADGSPVRLEITGSYPQEGKTSIRVRSQTSEPFALQLRIPRWASNPTVKIGEEKIPTLSAGAYLVLKRNWTDAQIDLQFDLPIWTQLGAREAVGKASVYRGPLLLAWDQRFNNYDADRLPILEPAAFQQLQPLRAGAPGFERFAPQVLLKLSQGERDLVLVDFATAGATGTRYATWLPVTNRPPAPVVTRFPRDGAVLPPGELAFRWTGSDRGASYKLEVGDDENFSRNLYTTQTTNRAALVALSLAAQRDYFWRVLAKNSFGETKPSGPPARFRHNPNLPPVAEKLPPPLALGSNGELIREPLHKEGAPSTTLNGLNERLIFPVPEWPEEAFSVALRFRIDAFPEGRMGQLFSAWAGVLDDPLRLTIENGKLSARIEAGSGYGTPGVPVEKGRWYSVAAVRDGASLKLYLDGKERGSATVPQFTATQAKDFALGGNPHYIGNEHLAVTVADLAFYARSLDLQETSQTPTLK